MTAQFRNFIAKYRISFLYSKLINIVGNDLASSIIDDILNENGGDVADGDNAGCA